MLVIPAIDLIGGKAVRLTEGDYSTKKTYFDDPLEAAKAFEGAGIKRLHLVDLDGAKGNKPVNLAVLERIKKETLLTVDFGGGIKTREALVSALDAGADYITCGSAAVKLRDEVLSWAEEFPSRLILGADCRNGKISISGWAEDGGIDVLDFIDSFEGKGFAECISTDISKDGRLEGPSFTLYERIMKRFPSLKLIASGGISSAADLYRLRDMGIYGAITGKAFYEGRLTLEEMRRAGDAC